MDYLEKFDYQNFVKFHNEINANPQVIKPRDIFAEKALDFFGMTEDELHTIGKLEILKDLYKFLFLMFYVSFKNNPEVKDVDPDYLRAIEKEFPDDTGNLRRNLESWGHYASYFSGQIDALSKVLDIQSSKKFQEMFGGDSDEEDED